MPIEVELRIPVRDQAALVVRLEEVAHRKRTLLREDVYFAPPEQVTSYLVPPLRFRLRIDGERRVVTIKDRHNEGGIEVNDEHEFQVDDTLSFVRFVLMLGFEPFAIKRKRVTEYRRGRAVLELNEVEHLGTFLEIEILVDERGQVPTAQQELRTLVQDLGIEWDEQPVQGYVALLRQKRQVRYRFDPSLPGLPFVEL